MLNPEVIELCGKRSVDVLNELIASFGEDAADTCYVKTDDLVTVNGATVPGSICTNNPKYQSMIQIKCHDYIFEHDNPDTSFGIFILGEDMIEEGDIKLWLSSN